MARPDLAQIGTPKLPVKKKPGRMVGGEGEEGTNHSSFGHLEKKEHIDTEQNSTSLNLHGKCHILFKIFCVTKHSSHPKEIEKFSTFFSQLGALNFIVSCVCAYCFQHFWLFSCFL